jgi:hypothetical protein
LSKKEKLSAYQKNRDKLLLSSKLTNASHFIGKGDKIGVVEINGRKESLYMISYVASTAGRSKDTIDAWTKIGFMPKPLHTHKKGFGLYTNSQILYLEALIKKIDLEGLFLTTDNFRFVLDTVWNEPFSIKRLNEATDKTL